MENSMKSIVIILKSDLPKGETLPEILKNIGEGIINTKGIDRYLDTWMPILTISREKVGEIKFTNEPAYIENK